MTAGFDVAPTMARFVLRQGDTQCRRRARGSAASTGGCLDEGMHSQAPTRRPELSLEPVREL